MRVNIIGQVTAHCVDVSGPSALPVTGLHPFSQGRTPPHLAHSEWVSMGVSRFT